jgi:tetratricopeptide (TPR) repeat protein
MKTEQLRNGRPRLSVAMIVRNEQEVIAETLQSVRAIADEIVVWDSGSEDETIDVARKNAAKVFQGFWKNDFSAARNACSTKVTADWVLWLDAGEKLSDLGAKKLREFVDTAADLQKAYSVIVEVPPGDTCSTGEQIAQPRLLPTKANLKFEGRVRETLYPSIQAAGLKTDSAPVRIVRHPRQHSQERRIRHANRNLGLVELELIDNEIPTARLHLAQGEAFVSLGSYDRAREAFIKAIDLAEAGSTEMLEGYYGLLTGYNNDPKMRDAQVRVCLNALEVFPLDVQLLLAIGSYFQARNRLDLATRAFETAVRFGQTNPATWHLCDLPGVAVSCLCLALQLQNKDEEACRMLEEAFDRTPQSARLSRLAMDLYIKCGNVEQALGIAQRAGITSGSDDPLVMAIRGACSAAKQEWTPALGYLQSAYLMGCHSVLCLRWLAVTLLCNGQGQAAKPVLEEWQKLEPTNPELLAYIAAVAETQESISIEKEEEEEIGEATTAVRQYRLDSGAPITEVNAIKIPFVPHLASPEMTITEDA